VGIAAKQMMQLNKIGALMGKLPGVTAMTDVTGFGLLGHLVEMAEGSNLSAVIDFEKVPLIIPSIQKYLEQKSIPGGTGRNWDSYGDKIAPLTEIQKSILADPQTGGGLLIAVDENAMDEVVALLKENNLTEHILPIGELTTPLRKASVHKKTIITVGG
jgi:selenide,water dikinase